MLRRLAFLAGVLALFVSLAPAADWPQFRGPNRDGVSKETGLLQEWPKGGPEKVWTVTGAGDGFGSVAVVNGTIFGMGIRNKKDVLWAKAESDGKELWVVELDDAIAKSPNMGPSGSPTVAEGRVYVVSTKGKLACLDVKDGKRHWQVDYLKDFGGGVPGWGYCESVLVDGDKVICIPGSAKATVVALKVENGKEVWRTTVANPGGAQGYSSAVKTKVGDTEMYVLLLGKKGGVIGVDVKTGKLLWQYAQVTNNTANIPTPVVKGELVWTSTGYGDGGSALLQIVPSGDNFTAKEVVKYGAKDLQNHHGGMVLVGDHIYFGKDHNQGRPCSVEFKTGEVAWKETKGAAGGNGSAGVTAADGLLVFNYENGKVVLLAADPKKLDVRGSFDIPEWSRSQNWAHPVIANGKLFLRDQDKLHCYDIKKK